MSNTTLVGLNFHRLMIEKLLSKYVQHMVDDAVNNKVRYHRVLRIRLPR